MFPCRLQKRWIAVIIIIITNHIEECKIANQYTVLWMNHGNFFIQSFSVIWTNCVSIYSFVNEWWQFLHPVILCYMNYDSHINQPTVACLVGGRLFPAFSYLFLLCPVKGFHWISPLSPLKASGWNCFVLLSFRMTSK